MAPNRPRPSGSTVRLALLLAVLAAATVGAGAGQVRSWRPTPLPPDNEPTPGLMCEPPAPDGRARTTAVADGRILSFRQHPPWLLARDDHGLQLRRFLVAGDVDRVRFDRWDAETSAYVEETWSRQSSETVAGRLVSVFEPSWTPQVVQQRLARTRVGLDQPSLWLGNFRGPADAPSVYQAITLRVGSSAIAGTEVVRVDHTVQYASHVVNLVVPSFGDTRLNGDFDLRALARMFYQHFEDTYDVLAVVPYDQHVDTSALAFHQRVKNDVSGLGLPMFDRSAEYGSAGRLRGVEVFYGATFGTNDISAHELAHTWGHDFNWTRIAGITRAGASPTSHAPLITGGETLVGAVLEPTRRVSMRSDDSAVLERTPAPARHHPLDLYAMGLLEPGQLPAFVLFEDQGQFSAANSASPAVGTVVTGGRKSVSINDVMAAHGARQGPVLTDVRRATIVVSRDGLLPATELAGWNFLAARQEDRGGTDTIDYDGVGSFDASTNRRIDLSTDIRPRDGAPLPRTQDPDPPRMGALDCRGFEFTSAPPTRVRAGERFTIAGRSTARDRTDIEHVGLRLWPSSGNSAHSDFQYVEMARSGEFRIDFEVRSGREGQYLVQAFLFWPGAQPQFPRCTLSVLNVTR